MASRSVPTAYTGMLCPESISFSYTHGANASIGSLTLPGKVETPVGMPLYMNIGNSLWAGFVTDYRYSSDGNATTVNAVDWRDRLADTHVYGAFNMQEDDGRIFHVLPDNWLKQKRTYVARELNQYDFREVQSYPPNSMLSSAIAGRGLFSVASILNYLANRFQFRVYFDGRVASIIQTAYPMNIDWNSGARTIDAIVQLLERCNVQLCCVGTDIMYLTVRGFTDNPFLQAFLAGQVTHCSLGAHDATYGEQFHDKGRRVVLQGDRNRYEFVYICRANWNPRWTWELAYGGFALGAMLERLGLTHLNKIKELPKEFHDTETWTESFDVRGKGATPLKRTRMEMTIEEYLNKIVFKAYVVDARAIVHSWIEDETDSEPGGEVRYLNRDTLEFTGERNFITGYDRWPRLYNDRAMNFRWPISNKLPTESNLQYLTYVTSRRLIQGVDNPFYHQQTLVPRLDGANLDVEEILTDTGDMEYRVRVFFNEAQFHMKPGVADADINDPTLVRPDYVLVRMSVDADVYTWFQGERENGPRVREHRIVVPNLSKAYLNNEEVSFLSTNYQINLRGFGTVQASRPVRADDIARSIATSQLFRTAIQRTGDLVFKDRAGTLPDGIIESVSVRNNGGDIEEIVNFGTSPGFRREVIPPAVMRMAYKFLDETELNRKRLLDAAKKAMEEMRKAAAEKKPDDAVAGAFGGRFAPHRTMASFAKEGAVAIKYDKRMVAANEYEPGDVILVRGPREAGHTNV